MQLKSIQAKILLLAGSCLLASAASLVCYNLYSTTKTQKLVSARVGAILEQEAKRNLTTLAANQAAVIQSALEDNLVTARTMAKVFAVVREHMARLAARDGIPNPSRDILNDILHQVLENNPAYLGAYSAWEPDALDGRDKEFAGKTDAGYDATGRFIPYWNRDANGKIARQALVDYESRELNDNGVGKGAWYLGSRETGKEIVLDPLPYIIQGKRDWLTTLNAPIKENGKYLGLAGTDLRLNFLQDLAGKVDTSLYGGKGDVAIVSHDGLVVASSEHPEAIGLPLKNISAEWEVVTQNVKAGKAMLDVSPATGVYRALAPISLGRSGRPWAVLIRVHPDIVLAESRSLDAQLTDLNRENTLWQVGVGLGVTALALGVLWVFASGLVRPLRQAAAFAGKVAEGDFSQTLDIHQADETGILAKALTRMVANLKEMIAQAEEKTKEAGAEAARARAAVADAEQARRQAAEAQRQGKLDAADRVEDVARAVAQAAQDLSLQVEQSKEGADLQRQHAGETATAMEQMNATVLEVAKNASEAAQGAGVARDKAKDGADVVRQVVAAINGVQERAATLRANMDELGKQADGIGNIIGVISDIADQTNLLALNAAIEAARAGEAGRGFAVVADEVRKLAEKTMNATGEVGNAVRAIQAGARSSIEGVEGAARAVDRATELASHSGAVLGEIVSIVENSADQVRSIATASEEQSAASEQINRAVDDINRISEETADAMARAAGSVEELAHQAQNLTRLVETLKAD
ncbi:methyl-accepting chemotaxis sensory transducer with Cache sensor [Solidesulfovibrio carbinoliphilus subsp. oakridgensis]|uniref:Methyl-accepting chemotaxis sensory transducer with Cache sensor n=1 Tax=Solidesulfovibrio carbinoliphilus subsp. oakridgensis TaxID=694327 RepID=G7Q5G3_9BACT|nr:methyl-accepting chemotaxis sensory transducer with Cache sensor [Solidesulfovibrio carbinoliphilus subsp. oakridgensis]